MTKDTDLDALRPEFTGLTNYIPPYFAVDVQAYMDCMKAIAAAEEVGHPMPLFVTWAAFGRLKLLSITLSDLYDKARVMVESGEAQAQEILRQGGGEPEYVGSMTAAHWDRNTAQHARRIVEAALAEDEAAS